METEWYAEAPEEPKKSVVPIAEEHTLLDALALVGLDLDLHLVERHPDDRRSHSCDRTAYQDTLLLAFLTCILFHEQWKFINWGILL